MARYSGSSSLTPNITWVYCHRLLVAVLAMVFLAFRRPISRSTAQVRMVGEQGQKAASDNPASGIPSIAELQYFRISDLNPDGSCLVV